MPDVKHSVAPLLWLRKPLRRRGRGLLFSELKAMRSLIRRTSENLNFFSPVFVLSTLHNFQVSQWHIVLTLTGVNVTPVSAYTCQLTHGKVLKHVDSSRLLLNFLKHFATCRLTYVSVNMCHVTHVTTTQVLSAPWSPYYACSARAVNPISRFSYPRFA